MKKTFTLVDLDCAHCASKIEYEIRNLQGVENATVNFISQKLYLELADTDADIEQIIKEIKNIIARIEPDCELVE